MARDLLIVLLILLIGACAGWYLKPAESIHTETVKTDTIVKYDTFSIEVEKPVIRWKLKESIKVQKDTVFESNCVEFNHYQDTVQKDSSTFILKANTQGYLLNYGVDILKLQERTIIKEKEIIKEIARPSSIIIGTGVNTMNGIDLSLLYEKHRLGLNTSYDVINKNFRIGVSYRLY